MEDRPARAPSPSSIIRRELDKRQWSREFLAHLTGFPKPLVDLVIDHDGPINDDMAHQLLFAFGTSVKFWTNLEAAYRAHQA